jgi:hypothetical protein
MNASSDVGGLQGMQEYTHGRWKFGFRLFGAGSSPWLASRRVYEVDERQDVGHARLQYSRKVPQH